AMVESLRLPVPGSTQRAIANRPENRPAARCWAVTWPQAPHRGGAMNQSVAGDPETSELLLRLERGDRSAFDELFAIYRPALSNFVRARLGHRLGARLDQSDVVQDILLDVYLRLGDYLDRRPMPFRTWLWQT